MSIIIEGGITIGPGINIIPEISTIPELIITANTLYNGQQAGSVTYDITNTGNNPILESGILVSLGTPNYDSSVNFCTNQGASNARYVLQTTNFPTQNTCGFPTQTNQFGSYTQWIGASYGVLGDTVMVVAYAINSVGVAYSAPITWNVGICLVEGTLITLSDNTTKVIEDIMMTDKITVWDFDNGVITSALPLWIKKTETSTQYNLLTFSDGSTLKTVSQHRIFNKEAGAFTYPMTEATPIGTTTINVHGEEITLVDKCIIIDTVNYYNVITDYHLNLYADGILTSMRYNNVYPIVDMKYVKDNRVLRSIVEFSDADIAQRWVDGLRLTEQIIPLSDIKLYVDRLERNENVISR
jgi:hypothetical protein